MTLTLKTAVYIPFALNILLKIFTSAHRPVTSVVSVNGSIQVSSVTIDMCHCFTFVCSLEIRQYDLNSFFVQFRNFRIFYI